MKKNSYLLIAASFLLLFVFIPIVHADDNGKVYEVGAHDLTVREAPDHEADAVGYLHTGDQVTVFKEKFGWVQTYYGGTTAWVASQYLYEASGSSTSDPSQLTTENNHQSTVNNSSEDSSGTSADESRDSKNETVSTPNESNDTSELTGNSLDGYNIMLDAGHGGKDPGAIGISGEQEADLALDISKVVAQKLRSEGATVLLTRPSNSFVSLDDRMRINDDYWTDAFISLHLNASVSENVNGVSTHYYENGPDKKLAQSMQSALGNKTDMNNRGISQDNYHVLRENSADSVLVELGFITNPSDLERIKDTQNTSSIAEAIAAGLQDYLQ